MKKQKILIVLLMVTFFLLVESFDFLISADIPIEEYISSTIEKDEFSVVKFKKGYICIYFDKIDNVDCLNLSYFKKNIFGDKSLNLRASIADNANYYLNNTNIQKYFFLPLNNFSNHTIYFSCCEKEFAYPVEVNGEKVELVDVEIKMGTEVYKRTFWFYFGEDEKYPTVKAKNTAENKRIRNK